MVVEGGGKRRLRKDESEAYGPTICYMARNVITEYLQPTSEIRERYLMDRPACCQVCLGQNDRASCSGHVRRATLFDNSPLYSGCDARVLCHHHLAYSFF